jgi:hypothetical protein
MYKNNKKEAIKAALINLLVINQIMSRLIGMLDEVIDEEE